MDQPTNIKIEIKGNKEEVKKAAFVMQRRIDKDSRNFNESNYVFDDSIDFEQKMKNLIGALGSQSYNENENGTAVYTSEQESYGCLLGDDIKEIGEDVEKASLDVEVHISAVLTVTCSEGYDLCVDVDYVDGQMKVNITEEYYEDEEDDEDWDDEEDWDEE